MNVKCILFLEEKYSKQFRNSYHKEIRKRLRGASWKLLTFMTYCGCYRTSVPMQTYRLQNKTLTNIRNIEVLNLNLFTFSSSSAGSFSSTW